MTENNAKNITSSKLTMILSALLVVLFSADVWATSSPNLFITGTLPQCTYPQKRGGGKCLEQKNAKSCMNTTPFSPVSSGVTSEMCARGKDWCDRNDPQRKHKRCQNVDKGIVKNHEGYDYSAACGTPIYAPCDGQSTYNAGSSTKPIKFKCEVCGKTYEYTFHHTSGTVGNGPYKKGQQIGWSGNATGYPCHMHIEIRQGGLLMDPMNAGFDDYVCSCKDKKEDEEKVNRMDCFDPNTLVDPEPVNTGYEPSSSGITGAIDRNLGGYEGRKRSIDPDCIFTSVQASYVEAGCIFCMPFRIMFNAASIMAGVSYNMFAKATIVIVVVGFAIWLAFIVLRFVSHFEIRDPRNMIKIFLSQIFKVLFVIVLLQGPLEQILDLSLNPVFSTGFKIAQMGSDAIDNTQASVCNIVEDPGDGTVVVTSSNQTLGVTPKGGLPIEMGNSILCTIKSVQDKIIDIIALARVSHCLAWEHSTFIIPHFGYLISAVGFFVAGFLSLFGYSWLLVDAVLKMAISIALLPLALGAWPFKLTTAYLGKIWHTFIEAMFTFIFLSFIVMVLAAIAKSYANDIISPELRTSGILMWYTASACKLFFLCFLVWATLGEGKNFAKKFAQNVCGGSGMSFHKDIGAQTGGAVASTAKGAMTKYVAPTAKQVSKGIRNVAGENISHWARNVKKTLHDKYGGDESDGGGTAAIGDGGDGTTPKQSLGRTLYQGARRLKHGVARTYNRGLDKLRTGGRTWIGQDLNKLNDALHLSVGHSTFAKDSTGNIVQTTTIDNADGTKTLIKNDDFATVKTLVGRDGKETVLSVKTKTAARKIVDQNGEINQAKLRAIQQNSMLSEQERNMIIASCIHSDRMGDYVGGQLDDDVKNRDITTSTDAGGHKVITINQTNGDGTKSTFTFTFDGNRVKNTVETVDENGKGMAYATDGIVQVVTDVTSGKRENHYSVADRFHAWTNNPINTDGTVNNLLGRENILFDDDVLKSFGSQIAKEGFDTAYSSFVSFKK